MLQEQEEELQRKHQQEMETLRRDFDLQLALLKDSADWQEAKRRDPKEEVKRGPEDEIIPIWEEHKDQSN